MQFYASLIFHMILLTVFHDASMVEQESFPRKAPNSLSTVSIFLKKKMNKKDQSL